MNKEFDFKPIDTEGMGILTVIEKADKFNRWTYDRISPFCEGKILEIGSGIGNISQYFIEEGREITLSDIRDNYCEILSNKFSKGNRGPEVLNIDLVAEDFEQRYQHLLGTFDTVFALNVIEHIYDEARALRNIRQLLRVGGSVIVLVPAYQSLYNGIDQELEHYRRYNRRSGTQLLKGAGFDIAHQSYFNAMGIFAWYFSGMVQKNRTIPGKQMDMYNKLVPLFRLVDKLVFKRFGLSYLVVGRKIRT